MNYIKHLTGIFVCFADDDRLTPYHVSLYIALFQTWNIYHFTPSFSIARLELMRLAKIRSKNTYARCIKELHQWGYISYKPSTNPLRGSTITCTRFDTSYDTSRDTSPVTGSTTFDTTRDTSRVPVVVPYINYINNKHIKLIGEQNFQQENFSVEKGKPACRQGREKKVAPKKRKEFEPPTEEKVNDHFRASGYSEVEAKKFYNYFRSVGWIVGKNKPMKDWKAAAENWMLNAKNFKPALSLSKGKYNTSNHERLNTETDKDYDIPL